MNDNFRQRIALYKLIAEFLFLSHCLTAVVLFSFWYFRQLYTVYILTLVVSLFSDLILGYCFLSKWEFYFRKKANPKLDYEHTFFSFYFNKYFGQKVKTRTVQLTVLYFLWGSLFLNIIYWARQF